MGFLFKSARSVIAWLVALIGVLLVITAVLNLFNIDEQPWWLLATYWAIGIAAILGGIRLSRVAA